MSTLARPYAGMVVLLAAVCFGHIAHAQTFNPVLQVEPTMNTTGTPNAAPVRDMCLNPSQWPTGWKRMEFFGNAYQHLAQMTDSQLSQCFTNLRNANKKLVVAMGVLKPQCATAVTCWGHVLPTLQRMRSLGATIAYVELDEPLTTGIQPMNYSYAVQETADFINRARLEFPGVGVILQEAYPRQSATTLKNFYRDVSSAAKTLTGTGVQYAQLDHDWHSGGTGTDVSSIQNSVRSNGMKFGVIFWRAKPSLTWYQGLMQQGLLYRDYRRTRGIAPDMLAVINWTGTPSATLPEADISNGRSFANSVRDFANTFAPYASSTYGLKTNERLTVNQSRTSVDGRFTLVYQGDGNLVLYKGSTPVWASNTSNHSTGQVVVQGDGNFVIYDASNVPLWASNTSTANAFLVVQSDGNLVLYAAVYPIWASNTNFY